MSKASPSPVSTLRSSELGDGSPFASVFVLRKLTARTASNGNPFLVAELGDRTGSFSSTVFSDNPVFETFKAAIEGTVFRIEGRIDHYQGRLSPKLQQATPLDESELTDPELIEHLVETPPEDAAALWQELQDFIGEIRHSGLAETVKAVFEEIGDSFQISAAAISMHHAYRHGLLEHTVHMARAGRVLLPLYPEVDADLALAGILLHDVGKVIEYEGTFATRRSRQGILQGHVVLGYQLTRKAGLRAKLDPDRLERLEHIILSHQGEPEWGAAVYAATPEAVFVAKVDDLDAKMGMVQRALRQAPPGEAFSERLPGLNTFLLLSPPEPE